MNKLARISHATTHALARLRDGMPMRTLRHACLAVLFAAPALGACPTLERAFDASVYASALDLVQSAIRDDDPWRADHAAAIGTTAGEPTLDDPPRPLYLAAQARPPLGDAMDLIAVAAAHATRAATAHDDAVDKRARTHGTLPGAPSVALFAMVAANDPSDDAALPMPAGVPSALAHPRPAMDDPPASAVAGDTVTPIAAPLVVLPVAEASPPGIGSEALLTSVPPLIPPVVGGAPPGTITPESGTPPVPAPSSGGFAGAGAPEVVPPPGGSHAGPGEEGAARPPARALPEPRTPWLLALAIALLATTLRVARAPRGARLR